MAPIHEAADRGHFAEVKRLVEEDPGLVNALDGKSDTPLIRAVDHGHLDVASCLIDQGARVNHVGSRARTALHVACFDGKEELAQLLLERGADPALVDEDGETAVNGACFHGRVGVVGCLLRHGGSPIDLPDRLGYTPLHSAALEGYLEVVNLVIQAGADPTISQRDGTTPLTSARKYGDAACVAVLEVRVQTGIVT